MHTFSCMSTGDFEPGLPSHVTASVLAGACVKFVTSQSQHALYGCSSALVARFVVQRPEGNSKICPIDRKNPFSIIKLNLIRLIAFLKQSDLVKLNFIEISLELRGDRHKCVEY